MRRPPSPPDLTWRTRVRRFAPVALVALAPKGVCCLAAYAASGALFGRELCGAAENSPAALLLPWCGGAIGGTLLWIWRHRRAAR
jgi:hypothetical protein